MPTEPGFRPLGIAILTVSDTRTTDDDQSGDILAERAVAAGHVLAGRAIARDEVEAIREAVSGWIADPAVEAVIVTGGTGLTGRDVTPEALAPLFDKDIPGFGELFRRLSHDRVGIAAIQSRALAGVADGTLIFALPGSPNGARDAWDWIIEPAFDTRSQPSSLAALLPRLRER